MQDVLEEPCRNSGERSLFTLHRNNPKETMWQNVCGGNGLRI